jgi:hypothetical protein
MKFDGKGGGRQAAGNRRREGNEIMTGIQFVTDDKGRKTGVLIDLKKHKELWEDIADVLVSRSRQRERRIPLEKVKADLVGENVEAGE